MSTIEDWLDAVGPGWREILLDTDSKLKNILPDYTIAQIKEKFGGLRYYYDVPNGTSEEVWHMLDAVVYEAERKSMTVCEMCGAPGTQRYGGWVKTLCDSCADRRELDRLE